MRCYASRGPSILLLDEHLRQLRESCKMYRIAVPFSDAELAAACKATVRANELGSCYVRPMVLVGYGAMGLDGAGSPIECYVPAWEWGGYLGDDSVFEAGIDCCTASWARAAPNTFPGMAKCAGNYVNAHLIKREAQVNGYAEAVALSPDGMVSEGSGQNIFVVRDGELVTPPINGSNLQGLTRRAVLALAAEAGVPARVEPVTREQLVVADELFFAGTATEVAPIRSLGRHVSAGRPARPDHRRIPRPAARPGRVPTAPLAVAGGLGAAGMRGTSEPGPVLRREPGPSLSPRRGAPRCPSGIICPLHCGSSKFGTSMNSAALRACEPLRPAGRSAGLAGRGRHRRERRERASAPPRASAGAHSMSIDRCGGARTADAPAVPLSNAAGVHHTWPAGQQRERRTARRQSTSTSSIGRQRAACRARPRARARPSTSILIGRGHRPRGARRRSRRPRARARARAFGGRARRSR